MKLLVSGINEVGNFVKQIKSVNGLLPNGRLFLSSISFKKLINQLPLHPSDVCDTINHMLIIYLKAGKECHDDEKNHRFFHLDGIFVSIENQKKRVQSLSFFVLYLTTNV